MKTFITSLIVMCSLMMPSFSDGKGSSSSGSRSSSSSSSSRSSFGGLSSGRSSTPSSPSRPSFGGLGSTKPSTPAPAPSSPSSFGGLSSSKATPPSTSTTKPSVSSNNALNSYKRDTAATPPKSRDAYVSEFKKANETKYPTKFASEPASRPSYIPSSYNGAPVTYNAGMGGYGYTNALGQFMLYDALTDIAAAQYVSYAAQPRPAVYAQPTVVHGGPTFGGFFVVLLIVGAIGLIVYFIRKNSYS